MEVQSLLVAEVVGGAKTTAKKSSLKNLNHLWVEVSIRHIGRIFDVKADAYYRKFKITEPITETQSRKMLCCMSEKYCYAGIPDSSDILCVTTRNLDWWMSTSALC